MSRNASKETVKKTKKIVREYLDHNDNGRGEVYVKASTLAEKEDDMNARRVGRGLAELENKNVDGLGIERWGIQRSTRWRAFYKE